MSDLIIRQFLFKRKKKMKMGEDPQIWWRSLLEYERVARHWPTLIRKSVTIQNDLIGEMAIKWKSFAASEICSDLTLP